MASGDRDLDTICAISTPSGMGGIAVIRVSGKRALQCVSLSCAFLPQKPETHRVFFGVLRDPHSGEAVDEVLVTFFQQGKSFTGEEVLEISCHGSVGIAQRILNILVQTGCRIADRGEFTYRAFIGGRMDLVQAEGVLSLIQSQGKQSANQALRQLRGELSERIRAVEANLIWLLARLEVGIDFSTEDVQVVDESELAARLELAAKDLIRMTDSYRSGKVVKDGIQMVLVGQPNVGKSSLLNVLAEEEKAIVSDVPGTTRDLIEATFFVGGFKVVVTDTAGLRQTEDRVEKIGIERSHKAMGLSDITVFIFDLGAGLNIEELAYLEALDASKVHLVGNKKDQFKGFLDEAKKRLGEQLKTLKNFQKTTEIENFIKSRVHFVSALDRSCGDELRAIVGNEVSLLQVEDLAVVSQARHFENLSGALENVERALGLLQAKSSAEFLALEMKEALILVQATLGKRFDDEIMDRVFRDFCIGK